MSQLTLFAAVSPARILAWPESVTAWLENDQDFGISSIELSLILNPDGSSSKTSLSYSLVVEAKDLTSQSFLQDLPDEYRKFLMGDGETAGLCEDEEDVTTSLGECWTLNTLEYPNDAVESSLSQVLETDFAPKYYLTPKACHGILRRAKVRGRTLPVALEKALEMAAQTTTPHKQIT